MRVYKLKEIGQERFTFYCNAEPTNIKRFIGPFAPNAIEYQVFVPIDGLKSKLEKHSYSAPTYLLENGTIIHSDSNYRLDATNLWYIKIGNVIRHVSEIEYSGMCLIDDNQFFPFSEIEFIGENAPAKIVLDNLQKFDW